MDGESLRSLLESWRIAMDAAGASRNTMRAYMQNLTQLTDWADARHQDLDLEKPDQVREWLSHLRDKDLAPASRRQHLAAIRSFGTWLVEEGELAESGAHRVDWPQVGERIPDALTRDQLAALLRTCDARSFTGIRDAAILSLMLDSLVRADELLRMRRRTDASPGDVDLRERTVRITGKGDRERISGFSKETARLLDRYQRARPRQRYADVSAYWLASGRGALAYSGLYTMVKRRGERAGIDVHPHMMRAGGAVEWREKGGSVPGLMAVAGWKTVTMVAHYTSAAEQRLAIAEQRRLNGEA